MSFFYITNNKIKFNNSKKYYDKSIFETEQIDLSENYSVLIKGKNINNKYHNSPLVLENSNYFFIGLGTFFNEKGYFKDCINLDDELNFEGIYGHFVFIVFYKKNNCIKIITDKIGLINVFFTSEKEDLYISSDPFLLALSRDRIKLSLKGVNEYLLNESTLGDDTIIDEVRRLKLGHSLSLNKNKVVETLFYNYKIDKITKEEYYKRIDDYFLMVSSFKGKIGVEVSAGYDTKLVISCFNKTSKKFIGITNDNTADNGVDVHTSKVIAKVLGFGIKVINREGLKKAGTLIMSHYFTLSRNIIRSSFMPAINKEKYKYCDLLIGGYGGEVLRGKYCKYESTKGFLLGYYKLKHLLKDNNGDEIFNDILNKMGTNYPHKDMVKGTFNLSNWFYTMDRMRIWGGGETYGKHIDGLRLHPFMDWYLLSPIFGFSDSEIEKDKLVKEIIYKNAPSISDIPINAFNSFLVDKRESLIFKPALVFFKLKNLILRLKDKMFIVSGLSNKISIEESKIKEIVEYCNENKFILLKSNVNDYTTKLYSLNNIFNKIQILKNGK